MICPVYCILTVDKGLPLVHCKLDHLGASKENEKGGRRREGRRGEDLA